MKGGLIGLVVGKAWSALVMLILVFMLLIAVVGQSSAANLAGSAAVIGGTSTGLVFGSLPEFFKSVKDGQSLVKSSDAPATAPTAKAKN